MPGQNTPPTEDTTQSQSSDSPEWDHIENVQNYLAKMLRQHDAGKSIESEKVLAEIQGMLQGQAKTVKQEITDISAKQLSDAYWEQIAKRKDTVPTGLGKLNTMMGGGLEPQRLIVLLGAPGGGKTTFANQLGVHASESGCPVLYVTSEDMPFTLLAKTLARKGEINYTAVLRGYEQERERINATLTAYKASISAERLHYLDASIQIDMDTIREHARAHFERFKDGGQGVLIVDYLQRLARAQGAFRSGNQDLRQAVTVLTEQLRFIAVDLGCCVIALASQNRASGYGASNNTLASAKESGDIEYTADIIMALGDDEQRVPTTTWLRPKVLRIDKNRQGDIGKVSLDWYPERQQFTEVDEHGTEQQNGTSANGSRGKRGR